MDFTKGNGTLIKEKDTESSKERLKNSKELEAKNSCFKVSSTHKKKYAKEILHIINWTETALFTTLKNALNS